MTVRANGVPCIARLRMPAGGGEEAEVAEEGGRAAGIIYIYIYIYIYEKALISYPLFYHLRDKG